MEYTADNYFDRTHLMDLRVLSTLGLTEEDIQALAAQPGVERAEGAWYVDAAVHSETNDLIVRFHSLSEAGINEPELLEGRMPQSAGECVVEPALLADGDFQLGDIIYPDTAGTDYEGMLKGEAYTIVGTVHSPLYMSRDRGTSTIGTGRLSAVAFLPSEEFDADYYMEAYLLAEGTEELLCYGDDYEAEIDELTDRLEPLGEERAALRYDEVKGEAEKELADAQKEFDDAEAETEQKLADAEQELADAKKKLADGWAEYYDGKETLARETADAEQKLADGEKELSDALKKLQDGEAEYLEGKQTLADSREAYEKGKAEYEDGKNKYDIALFEYESGRSLYEEGLEDYWEGLSDYQDGQKELEEGEKAYRQNLAAIEEAEEALAAGRAQYEAGLAEYRKGETQFEAGKAGFNRLVGGLGLSYESGGDEIAFAVGGLSGPRLSGFVRGTAAFLRGMGSAGEADALTQAAASGDDAVMQGAAASALLGIQASLQEAEEYLAGAKAELDAANEEITENAALLEAGRQQLAAGKAELDAGKKQLSEAKEQLSEARKELADAKKQLDEGEAELADAKAQLDDAEQELADGYQALLDGEQELADARKELDDGWAEYEDGLKELADAKEELPRETAKAEKELADAYQELTDGQADYEEGLSEYEDAKAEAEEKLSDARRQLNDAKREIADLANCQWYLLSRSTNTGYVSYRQDAMRMGNLAQVFPLIFFLVAALVCLTTMTRMVEEQRVQIGGLKALGYRQLDIAKKYVGYGFLASFLGGVAGLALGCTLIPTIIFNAWKVLYTVGDLHIFLAPGTYALAMGAAVFCVAGAALASCLASLRAVPAQLMRPRAPQAGKRVFLERADFIWKRLSFIWKVTVRNLFRYKKRFLMTVTGIGGCTALLITGFGLRDSLHGFFDIQYDEITTYHSSVSLADDVTADELTEISRELNGQALVESWTPVSSSMITAQSSRRSMDSYVYLFAVTDEENFGRFVHLREPGTGAAIPLPEEGAVITVKLAELLGVKAGDEITLVSADDTRVSLPVRTIAENYVFHYVYLSEDVYRSLYGEDPAVNSIMLRFTEDTEENSDAVASALLPLTGVSSLTRTDAMRESVARGLEGVDYAVVIVVISAAALAFVVLYNLTNINITERLRELATLKVLGFTDHETSAYIYRENIFLTLFGILLGLVMGKFLHQWLVLTVEIDLAMFYRTASPVSYVISAILTVVFSALVSLAARGKLKKIDMVESLKTVE